MGIIEICLSLLVAFVLGFIFYHFFGPSMEKRLALEVIKGKKVLIIVDNKAAMYTRDGNKIKTEFLTLDHMDILDKS